MLLIHTVPGQASSAVYQYLVHIISPVTLNQRKGQNGRRNYFMTKLHERIFPDVRIAPAAVRLSGGHASGRATVPGSPSCLHLIQSMEIIFTSCQTWKSYLLHVRQSSHFEFENLSCENYRVVSPIYIIYRYLYSPHQRELSIRYMR